MSPSPDRLRPSRAVWACVAVLSLLHLLLAGQASIGGATPGFLLVATCVVAVCRGQFDGTVAGFALGLAFDLTGSGPVGLSALLGSATGFALGSACRGGLDAGWRPPLAACAVALLAYNLVYPLFLIAFGEGVELGWALVARVVASTVVDALVCGACLWALSRGAGPRTSGGLRLG